MRVEIVDVVGGKYMVNGVVNGIVNGYVLKRGNEYVYCDEVLIMETDSEFLEETFEEWKELGIEGESGYNYWIKG